MKTTSFLQDGAAENCANRKSAQGLTARCGRNTPIEAIGLSGAPPAPIQSELDTWLARRKTEGRFNEDLHLASRRVLLGLGADNSSGVMRASLMRDVERLREAASK